MARLEELKEKRFLDSDEVVEYFMLVEGIDRETAEKWFEEFSREYRPVTIQ